MERRLSLGSAGLDKSLWVIRGALKTATAKYVLEKKNHVDLERSRNI